MSALDNWGTFPEDLHGTGPKRPGAWADGPSPDEAIAASPAADAEDGMDVDRTEAARVGGPKSASRMQAAGLLRPRGTSDNVVDARAGGRIDPISVIDVSRLASDAGT